MRRLVRNVALAAACLVVCATAACAGDPGEDENGPNSIVVWTGDTLPDRVAKTRQIVDAFTGKTGIEVELVSVDEDQFNQLLISAAAAGDLPDVLGNQPLAAVRTLRANELLNTDAAAAVVASLGADTFSPSALELSREGETQLAVPTDAWSQLIYYRKDLFAAAGLKPPSTYADIMAAAEALDSSDVAGFVGATTPGDAFTQQTFEHLALANGCELVDGSGEIRIDSPQCVAAFQFYKDLVADYSVVGTQDVDTVRAAYFAGQAAMAVWSTYMLDELAGLREDALPSCPQCREDPTWLARNTGVVATVTGPDGSEPAQFGEVSAWAVTATAEAAASQTFVEYMLSDGYVDWLSIAPEGKYPVRSGNPGNPTEYVDAWEDLDVGVDSKAPLSDFYPQDVIDILTSGADNFSRWGITQGQGDLVGASLGELPVPQAIGAMTGGDSAKKAAESAAESLRQIQLSLT